MTLNILNRAWRRNPYLQLGHTFEEPLEPEVAFSKAGLWWEVSTHPVYTRHPMGDFGEFKLVPDAKAVVRRDTDVPLAVTGTVYTPINNHQVAEMLDGTGWKVKAAGELNGGRRCYAVLAHPLEQFDVGGEPHAVTMVARWNHDGGGGVKLLTQIWRQICTNGMVGLGGSLPSFNVRHTAGAAKRLFEINTVIGQVEQAVLNWKAAAEGLMTDNVSLYIARRWIKSAWPEPNRQEAKIAHDNWQKRQRLCEQLLEEQLICTDIAYPSVWDVFNVINEVEQYLSTTSIDETLVAARVLNRQESQNYPASLRVLQMTKEAE
jgi:hypothetical protein